MSTARRSRDAAPTAASALIIALRQKLAQAQHQFTAQSSAAANFHFQAETWRSEQQAAMQQAMQEQQLLMQQEMQQFMQQQLQLQQMQQQLHQPQQQAWQPPVAAELDPTHLPADDEDYDFGDDEL